MKTDDKTPVLPTLGDLETDAIKLAGLLQGLDLLMDSMPCANLEPVEGSEAAMARNAVSPMIEVLIERAKALSEDLSRLDLASRSS